jgi:hypothetical protein
MSIKSRKRIRLQVRQERAGFSEALIVSDPLDFSALSFAEVRALAKSWGVHTGRMNRGGIVAAMNIYHNDHI